MSSNSFKKAPAGAPQGYRTPSPPPIELISPASVSNSHAILVFDKRYGGDDDRKNQPALLGAYGSMGDDTESEHEVNGVPTASIQASAASVEGQATAGNQGATIDALATIALATSPTYASKGDHIPQLGHFSPQRPLVRQLHRPGILPAAHLTYVGHNETEERPSKRARSEAVVTSTQIADQRPTTSYTGHNLRSPFSPQTHGSHEGPSTLGELSASNSMSNDAELLLNLARATPFSPETNTSRGLPVINGEQPPAKAIPTRPQLPQEQEEGFEEPQMPTISDIERHEHSPTLATEGLFMLGGAQSITDEPTSVDQDGELDPAESVAGQADEKATRPELETSAPFLPTSNPVNDSVDVGLGDSNHDTPAPIEKGRPSHRGWPKGKPRGPRATWPGQKSGKSASGGSAGQASRPRRQAVRRKGSKDIDILRAAQSRGYDKTPTPIGRRHASLPPISQNILEPITRRHSTSDLITVFDGRLYMQQPLESCKVDAHNTQTILSKSVSGQGGSGNNKRLKSPQSAICATCKFTRNTLAGDNDINATSWINCDGCKSWFHFACAGFKNEREVRGVDKYICRDCRPKLGPTTLVRKSGRAHTAIDYAGLNEGVVKSSDENHEHHYIKPIKEGTITFLPENFARMRPELVTAEFFEKGNGMKEPVVIPAWMNPRPPDPGNATYHETLRSRDELLSTDKQHEQHPDIELFRDYEFDYTPDEGQDALDMVIPQNLTVRRVAELYGPEEKVEVIDVKSQEGEDKKWNMRRWADYYESAGEKVVRNVISLEVSSSKLGRLIKRPEIVRKLDLQDSVWPAEALAKGDFPRVQFYCLMSVADCFTDFHIDFGGSSVFYHILKGKKTFLFIPPKNKHLKKYEEWCLSPAQNWTFLPDQTKECYRVDLSEGDTMLIPSGWIHAVWTPENSLVIGGNFLTRLHFGMQIRIAEIEKNTKVARKFRYPHFQKIQWLTAIRYLEDDPVPGTVVHAFYNGQSFYREIPAYYEFDRYGSNSKPGPENYHVRYYSQYELEGLPELARYLLRTALISMGSITDGITTETRNAVARSIPKGHGEPLEIAKKIAMWSSWKRGNEIIPHWAYPDAVPASGITGANEKKLSAAAIRRLEREAAIEAYRVAPERQSARKQHAEALASTSANNGLPSVDSMPSRKPASKSHKANSKLNSANDLSPSKQNPLSTPKTSVLGPKRIACDACRKRRVKCKHKGPDEASPGDVRRNTAIAVVITNKSKETQSQHTSHMDKQPRIEICTHGTSHTDAKEGKWLSEAQGDNVKVEVWRNAENSSKSLSVHTDRQTNPRVAVATMQSSPASLKGSSHTSHRKRPKKQLVNDSLSMKVEAPQSKKGRNKACNDCRKSKRRCVHDDIGNVDPIKAQEMATPRGTSSKKRSRESAAPSEIPLSKRPKLLDDEMPNHFGVLICPVKSDQQVAVQDNQQPVAPYREGVASGDLQYDAAGSVITADTTVNNTIRVEPIDSVRNDGTEVGVDSSDRLAHGQTQQFSSPPDSVGQNGRSLQDHEEQEAAKQASLGEESFNVLGVKGDEVQLVETLPSPPTPNVLPEPSQSRKEASECDQVTRQDAIAPDLTFEASKAPVQGALQSIERNEGSPLQSVQASGGDNSTKQQRRQYMDTLSSQLNSPPQARPTDGTAFSPPLTPVRTGPKAEPMTSLLSRRSSRQPKEIQRFATEQSNGIHDSEKPRRRSCNTSTILTSGPSRSPVLPPQIRSSTKKTPSRPIGSIARTPKSETTQWANGISSVITNGASKRAGSETMKKGRASTGEISVEEDEDMRLARAIAEGEFGLRKRGGR
ncbi:MAG: Lysine-specific demethylase 7A [Candelina submexicana]|nr:MAG: Lysine-specific demethylase 7A [Candelina submexicana]